MKLTTEDIGFAIRDHLEGQTVHHIERDPGAFDGTREIAGGEIEAVDISDPHNPIIWIGDQRFQIHIVAI